MHLNRRTFTAATVTTAASLPLVNALAQSTPEASPVASPNAFLESRLLGIMEQYGVPGAVIAMSMPGTEPQILELGVANLETNEPISADMHFRIASITKTFVATVVLQLVDEGELTLENTVSEILPKLNVVNADIVTVRNLLQMRSGLPQAASNPDFMQILADDPATEVTIDQIFGLVADLPASAEPDTAFEYNNLNFDILGEMIHTLTGRTWHKNVVSRITEPLDMANTLMTNVPQLPEPAPAGYGYVDQEMPEEMTGATPEPQATPIPDLAATPEITPVNDAGAYDLTRFNPTIAGAAGGLISTIRDQLVWAGALANGELISPEMYAEQIDAQPLDDSGMPGGYGLGIIDFGGLYAHNGAINGFQSVVGGVPQIGLNVAVLTNCHPTIGFGDAATELLATLISS